MASTAVSVRTCTLVRTTSGHCCDRQSRICLSCSAETSLRGMHSGGPRSSTDSRRLSLDGGTASRSSSPLKRTSLFLRPDAFGALSADSSRCIPRWSRGVLLSGRGEGGAACTATGALSWAWPSEELGGRRRMLSDTASLPGTSSLTKLNARSPPSPPTVWSIASPASFSAVSPRPRALNSILKRDAALRADPPDSDHITPAPPASHSAPAFAASASCRLPHGVQSSSSSSSSFRTEHRSCETRCPSSRPISVAPPVPSMGSGRGSFAVSATSRGLPASHRGLLAA
mmetsp:Transcript_12965/g.25367  ORF Transcript_12965/g.25367 Transcript_12965/m.25367 type:complete len:286 (-) Transcript_12965:2654-3511(-)